VANRESPQTGKAATKTRNISRKGAKAAKKLTSGLGALGVLAQAIPVLDSHHGPLEILRKPRKLSSNTEFAKGLFTDGEGWGDRIQ
jgi:hypothetical protein